MNKPKRPLQVAVIGCGLIGKRRIQVARENVRTRLKLVVDVHRPTAELLAKSYGCDWGTDWRKAVRRTDLDLIVVSTPNYLLSPIACEALKNGKDVLIEKPMGRNLTEAVQIQKTALRFKRKLKIGFNHRYHPAIQRAYRLFSKGLIGKPINVRCQYGHGGRKGYENEWRGSPETSGGGELTDQGIHLIDLIQWFCGKPHEIFSYLQTAVWPIRPLEDNGFVLMKYRNGLIANFHASWTQWKNLFNFEIFGEKGSLCVQGLGGSYGTETLTCTLRKPEGGVPEIKRETFNQADDSWQKEWDEFIGGLRKNVPFMGGIQEGVAVMKTLDAIYRSHQLRKPIKIN